MSTTTTNLSLYKANPTTDSDEYFNLDTMLNDNWDKIDEALGAPAKRYAVTFVASDWEDDDDANGAAISTDKVIKIAAATHGITSDQFDAKVLYHIAPNCTDVVADNLEAVKTKIIAAFTAAIADTTNYPAANNTINMSWVALQEYILTGTLKTETAATADAAQYGFSWSEVETIENTTGCTLASFVQAAYQYAANLNVLLWPEIATVANINHLRLRHCPDTTKVPGLNCKYDLDGGYTDGVWGVMGVKVHFMPRCKDIIVRSPAAFDGMLQLVGA